MSFWNPITYFNGSKFYRLRDKYTEEYFSQAQRVIKSYNLKVLDLYDNTRIITLNQDEIFTLEVAIKNNQLESFKKNIEKQVLKGSIGSVEWLSQTRLRVHRKGLKSFCESLGMYRATRESGYIWHLVTPSLMRKWLKEAGIMIAALLLAQALAAIPIIGQAKWLIALFKYTTWYNSLLAFMALKIAELNALYEQTKLTETTSLDVSYQLSNTLLEKSLDINEHEKYAGGDLHRIAGYSIYAGGSLYNANSPGSENFKPSLAFKPFSGIINAKEHSSIDSYISNQAHYDLAGNAGYKQKINPRVHLSQSESLANDKEYKYNYFSNHNQRLQRGYAQLCKVMIDECYNYVKRRTYSASDYLKAVYLNDIDFYKNILDTYLQSKDMLDKLKNYNYAKRADFNYFNPQNRHTKITQTKNDNKDQAPVYEYGLDMPLSVNPSQEAKENLDKYISGLSMEADAEADIIDYELDYYNTSTERFKIAKRAFLETMLKDIEILINLIREEVKGYYLEYSGTAYTISNEELIDKHEGHIAFLEYAQATGGVNNNGGYGEFYKRISSISSISVTYIQIIFINAQEVTKGIGKYPSQLPYRIMERIYSDDKKVLFFDISTARLYLWAFINAELKRLN